ncbi:site-specific integrase [Bacillus pumilus]|uniref:site-specific integrase n=1 Tax=Bacillus pumilus TaxID=1408 RepID=UPI0011A465D5|nr:site-specific integrase [Bacillus pumilus]
MCIFDNRLYCLFYIALHTSMRQGKLLGLRWKDIDFKHKRLSVKRVMSHDAREMYFGAKTEAGNRSIDLGDKALEVLNEHRAKLDKEKEKYADIYKDRDLVFCTPYGTPLNPSNIRNRIMNPTIEETGVTKIRFHDLRHTCATILLLNGEPVKAVSERLGHKSIKVTLQTYAHVLPSTSFTSQQIADQMDGILN